MRSLTLCLAVLMLCSCQAIRDQAGAGAVAGLDNAAGQPVVNAVAAKDPALASTITNEAQASSAKGESWPLLKAILAHWEAIVGLLVGAGSLIPTLIARGKKLKEAIEQKNWLTAASEALSLGVELIKSSGAAPDTALAHAETTIPGQTTIRQAMELGGAKSAVLPEKVA